jgi:hypothetical protein
MLQRIDSYLINFPRYLLMVPSPISRVLHIGDGEKELGWGIDNSVTKNLHQVVFRAKRGINHVVWRGIERISHVYGSSEEMVRLWCE